MIHANAAVSPTSSVPALWPEEDATWRQGPIHLLAPCPPRLSRHAQELAAIEDSGIYSNYGPVNTLLERELIQQVFGSGSCVTVCNATIGLMLAIREVLGESSAADRRYALMPSFTFAATAQAALWCGLTPLFCDIDPDTWLPDTRHERLLLERYRDQVAVLVPYATFGNNLDLNHYQRLSEEHGVPVVIDAAASMGSLDEQGGAFGAGFPWPVVFSMHATKVFAVGEGGFIYSSDEERIGRLRRMGGFGFAGERSAFTLGLNSKLSEVTALTARLQLRHLRETVARRDVISRCYAEELGDGLPTQRQAGVRQVQAFQSVLLPRPLAPARQRVIEDLRSLGIGAGCYFSPHLAEQPLFRRTACFDELPVTQDIASRVLSLPLTIGMHSEQVRRVVSSLREVIGRLSDPAGLLAVS